MLLPESVNHLFHYRVVFCYADLPQFTYFTFDGRLGCLFQFLAIMNSGAINIFIHAFCWTFALILLAMQLPGHRAYVSLPLVDTWYLFL